MHLTCHNNSALQTNFRGQRSNILELLEGCNIWKDTWVYSRPEAAIDRSSYISIQKFNFRRFYIRWLWKPWWRTAVATLGPGARSFPYTRTYTGTHIEGSRTLYNTISLKPPILKCLDWSENIIYIPRIIITWCMYSCGLLNEHISCLD